LSSMKVPSLAEDVAFNQNKLKHKSHAQIGHQKMLEKPAYSVLMNRYQSLPHQPKTIKMTKINRLADPVKGRYTSFEKTINAAPSSYDEIPSMNRGTDVRATNPSGFKQTASPTKTLPRNQKKSQSAFFLTGEDDDEDDEDVHEHHSPNHQDHNIIETNKLNARNGFANILRTRVEEAHRIEVLQVPLKLDASAERGSKLTSNKSQAAINRQRLAKAAGALGNRRNVPAGKRQPPGIPTSVRKKAWHENTAIPHLRGDNKKPIAQVVAGTKTRKVPPVAVRRNGEEVSGRGSRKVLSSGYGGNHSQSVAKERVLKKIVGAISAPSLSGMAGQNGVQPAPAGNAVKRLRSKCTIDILETIEETRRRDAAVVESNGGKRTGKSGTRSAPLGSSGRSAVPNDDQGDTRNFKKSSSAQPMAALGRVNKKGGGSPPKAHPNSYVATRNTVSTGNQPPNSVTNHSQVNQKVLSVSVERDYGAPITISADSIEPSGILSPSIKSDSQYFISNNMMTDFPNDPVLSPKNNSYSQVVVEDDPVRQSENEYADIQSSIERLKQYGGAHSGDDKTKKDINTINLLSKKAVKLGSHFNNADDLMSRYKNLVNEFD
jgi:hypothetical protein